MQNAIYQQDVNSLLDNGEAKRAERMSGFIESCRFAKVIETAEGPAILIGGLAFNVRGPSDTAFHVEAIAEALRKVPGRYPCVPRTSDGGPLNEVGVLDSGPMQAPFFHDQNLTGEENG